MSAITLAIANQKGGVGKTTTTVNLGHALAAMGIPTLIVDMDPQANATSCLGMEKNRASEFTSLSFQEAILPAAYNPPAEKTFGSFHPN